MATLKQIQQYEVHMLKDLAKVCDDNDIPYYLAGGTLLGAVRHNGFIPWDDDIDINLLINDVKRLKKCCLKELPKHYFWQDVWTDRNYKMVWSRLRDTKSKICKVAITGEKSIEEGLFIDIIPLIYAAKSDRVYNFQIKTVFSWSYCVRNQCPLKKQTSSSFLKRLYRISRELLIYRIGGQLLFWLMLLLQNRKSKKLIVLDVNFYGNISESGKKNIKRILVKDSWLKPTQYFFEKDTFTSFSDCNAYLIDHYGKDYMIPRKDRIHIDPELSYVPSFE